MASLGPPITTSQRDTATKMRLQPPSVLHAAACPLQLQSCTWGPDDATKACDGNMGDDIVEDVATHLKSVQLAGPVRLSKLTHVCRTSTPTRFGVAILSGWACFGNLPVSPSNRPSGLQHRRQ